MSVIANVADMTVPRYSPPNRAEIKAALDSAVAAPRVPQLGSFGDGRSSEHFVQLLKTGQLFDAPVDKVFVDLKDVM